jgi:hypothetical protein
MEYTNIPNVLFTPHHVGHCCTNIRVHSWATMWLKTMFLGHCYTNMIQKHCCSTICTNKDLGSIAVQQCIQIIVTQKWPNAFVAHQCVPTMERFLLLRNNDPGHSDCLYPREKTWQTDTDGPIRCSSRDFRLSQRRVWRWLSSGMLSRVIW